MSMTTYEFDLPITPGPMPPVLHMAQYDTGRTFVAHLKNDDGTKFTPLLATAALTGINSAGVAWRQSASVSGGDITFTPTGAATDQPGKMAVTLTISRPQEKIAALELVFDIQRAGVTHEEAARSQEFQDAIEAAVQDALTNAKLFIELPTNGEAGQVFVSDGNGGAAWTTLEDTSGLPDGDEVSY